VPIPGYDEGAMTRFTWLLALAACSKGNAGGSIDAPMKDAPMVDAGPYSHRIMIDGVDDFLSGEQFMTTSAGYTARVTWDADNLYLAYAGEDLDPATAGSSTKWLFIYIDVDPGMPNGATVNETYNTQGATFPSGFRADYYVRWKCDASLLSVKQFSGAVWMDNALVPPASRVGSFVELAIPRALLAPSPRISLVTWMINEKNNAEGSYAGLYANNFTDGYAMNLALTKFLKIDFTAQRDPNDPANAGP
jgi:hypothetical protein